MEYEAFVITIMDLKKSVKAADRCIKSASMFNMKVEKFAALTPKDNPEAQFKVRNIPTENFEEVYSRRVNCMATFLSHFSLWERCLQSGKRTVIFEHDAIVTGDVPVFANFQHFMTFSKPSYGEFNTPAMLGVNPLTQKRYFGGAHGYVITPKGAWILTQAAQRVARPTDIFLNKENLPSIQEYYPWVCEARDSFSTIQNVAGIQMKHGLKTHGQNYELLNVK